MVILRRANQLKERSYEGIIQYLYKHVFPALIVLYGELMCIVLISAGITMFFMGILGSIVHNPIVVMVVEGMDMGNISLSYSGYAGIGDMLVGAVVTILGGWIVLLATHVAKEVYGYACKLVIVLIKFLPKFSIPISVRHRTIKEDQKFIE